MYDRQTNNDPGSVQNSGKITCQKPSVTVTKTPDNQTIDAGADAEYTITLANSGPGVATGATPSDPLPASGNWSISQAVNAGTCAITGAVGSQTLNCTFGDLVSGATRTLKVKTATGGWERLDFTDEELRRVVETAVALLTAADEVTLRIYAQFPFADTVVNRQKLETLCAQIRYELRTNRSLTTSSGTATRNQQIRWNYGFASDGADARRQCEVFVTYRIPQGSTAP